MNTARNVGANTSWSNARLTAAAAVPVVPVAATILLSVAYLGFRVQGSGFGVYGLRFTVYG